MFISWIPRLESVRQCLEIDPDDLASLHDITDVNLKVAGDLTDEQQFGQRSDALPWFWRIGDVDSSSGPRMQECAYADPLHIR